MEGPTRGHVIPWGMTLAPAVWKGAHDRDCEHEQKGPTSPDLGLRLKLWKSTSEDELLDGGDRAASQRLYIPTPRQCISATSQPPAPASPAGAGHLAPRTPAGHAPPPPAAYRHPGDSVRRPTLAPRVLSGITLTTGFLSAFPDPSHFPVSPLPPPQLWE